MLNLFSLIFIITTVLITAESRVNTETGIRNKIHIREARNSDNKTTNLLFEILLNPACCNRFNPKQNYSSSYIHQQKWFLLPKPKVSDAPKFPFLPYFVGLEGKSILSSKLININDVLVKTVNRIASEIIVAEDITGGHTLSTFNIMVELIRTATYTQIENVTSILFTKLRPETDSFKYLCWTIFRDGVIEAGTGPSIISLYTWIKEELVSGEEAAQLVSTITNTAQYPTEEFMQVFFELVKLSDKMNQSYLNSSSVLAFTSLIKKTYVCKKSTVQRYPVYSFGIPISKKSKLLENIYFPYLENKLREAVEEEDSHKIQVYIRSIGNTAHTRILQVFKPYLNGKIKVSNFQRLLMVTSLDSLTIVNPKLARSVLYKIYLNSEESTEIRTAAVALLMRSNPTSEMLQRMAEATNWDSSDHVSAAVKSAIESAAVMSTENELGKKARKAVNLLTPKAYGLHYSTNHIRSFISEENLGYSLSWNHIQSHGNIFPSSFFFTLRPVLGDFIQRAYKYSWMTSSTDGFLKLLEQQILRKHVNSYQDKKDYYWTPVTISKMLGIQPESREQFEGNIYTTLHGARRFIAFDNHTIEELPRLIKFASSAFRIGDSINYTKVYNQFSIKLAFPTITGLPFIFTLEAPTLVSLVGDLRINSHPDLANGSPEKVLFPQFFNLTTDLKAQFVTKTEAKLGFVTPFNHQHYLAGYDSSTQINLPLRIKLDVDTENSKIWTKLQPLYPNKYQKIAEYSTLAYTTKHDILQLSPSQLDDNTQIIYNGPAKEFSTTKGQHMTGFSFELKGITTQEHSDIPYFINTLRKHDLLSTFLYFNKKPSIEPLSNYSIYFNPHKTTAKFAKFVLNYADVKAFEVNEESENSLTNDAIPTVGLYEHKKKVDQLLKRSTSGMRDSYAQAFDFSAEFEGETNGIFTLTGAYSRSYVTQKARYLLFLAKEPAIKSQNLKPLQMALDVRATVPNVPLGNFKEAIKSDPTSSIVARLNFGEKATSGVELLVKGHIEKSPERVNYLLQQPISKQCEKEMNESNYLLQSCHNVTTRANFMDQYYFRVDYHNVTNSWKKSGYDVYSVLRNLAFHHITENIFEESNPSERIEIEAIFSPELNSLNASITTPTFSANLQNVRVNRYFQPALIMHPHYTAIDRMYERIVYSENPPRCVLDDTYAITFDSKIYPLFIGRCWHAMFHYKNHLESIQQDAMNQTSPINYNTDVTILVRDKEVKQREMILVLGENVIKFHTNDGIPTDYFTVNGEKYEVTEEVVGHYEEKTGKTVIQAYKLPTGTMRVYAPEHGIIILYDGYRVEVQAFSQYRGKILGLCGTYDGEMSTDFTSPKNCILKNPLEFTSMYAIFDGFCLGPFKELHHQADEAPCYKQTITYSEIIGQDNVLTKTHSHSKIKTNMDLKTLKSRTKQSRRS